MLKSTILFVAILTDVSAKYELSPVQLKEVAVQVAQEPEFKGNSEIPELIKEIDKDTTINHLKKIAYKTNLKDKI